MTPCPPIELHESDLITPAGAIDRSVLMRIAANRARRELTAYAAMGAPRPWPELLGEELRRTWSIAEMRHECAHGRRDFTTLTPAEQRIRQLEFRLERLRHGLATPSCVKTQDDIAHYENLLTRARVTELSGKTEAGSAQQPPDTQHAAATIAEAAE